jgi:anti-anti-sigma regulatory factor
MQGDIMNESRTVTIRLDQSSDLRLADSLREQLLRALYAEEAIQIDADGVEDIDISTIQLLVSAKKTAGKMGRSFALTSAPKGALAETLVRAGFMTASGESLIQDGVFWKAKA